MRCLLFLLLCCLAWFSHCVASRPNQALAERNGHPGHRSRKYCDHIHNNHTSADLLDCSPGYYRERQGPYKGQCVPCNCNGLSSECDPNTGKCLSCQLNTAGDHCERCAEGHYGSAALRTCRICPCPLSQPSHSFALGCLNAGEEFECLCKPGYSGSRCERCAVGYYGDPLADRGTCQLCDCDHGYLCDPITGACEDPDDLINNGDCQECDSCVQTLTDDLEAMDSELSRLKDQIESFGHDFKSLTALWKLEDAINATKVLVNDYRSSVEALRPKVKELETDVDGVRNDMGMLEEKEIATSLTSKKLLKDVNETHQRGQNLLTDTQDLLERITALLEQLKDSDGTSSMPDNDITRMLEEARRMVAQMQRQNCKVSRRVAEHELWEAQKLLDYIMANMTDPLNSTQATADIIAQDLMSSNKSLKDLEEVLKRAQKAVKRTNVMNIRNEADLSGLLERFTMFKKEQDRILADLAMIRETLGVSEDLQIMMDDLKSVYAQMAAEVDGANVSLTQRLNELSKATRMDDLVIKAEEHAQDLMNMAGHFQMSLLNFTNISTIYKAIEIINDFSDVISTIKEAEAAASEAHKAADQALVDVTAQDLTQKAQGLKSSSNALDDKAKTAENDLREVAQMYDFIKERLDKAKAKASNMKQDIQTLGLNISRDDIGALLNQALDAVKAANNSIRHDEARLQSVREGLDNIKIPSGDSNLDSILNQVNQTLNELDKFFPSLTDTLAKVENQTGRFPSRSNMSESIMRIKDMIERTRQMANMVRGPVLFSGESHIEMRPPKHLVDLQAFTALNLMLGLPKDDLHLAAGSRRRRQGRVKKNLFVLYLGNKNAQRDYVGMVVRNDVLYFVYKLGGIVHKVQTVEITRSSVNNSFMDKMDFHRVYQDSKVIYTQQYSSVRPKTLPAITSRPNTTVALLDLNPDDVVFYIGGYPDDFTPPSELQYPKYRGCIEFNTLDGHILSLYNFQRAVNVKNTDRCLRIETHEDSKYFDGTGYGRIDEIKGRAIKFFVLSRQEHALLFYMGNEDSHFTIAVEGGFVVLRVTQGNRTLIQRSQEKIFPVEYFQIIRIIQPLNHSEIRIQNSVNILINYRAYKQAFVGGIPAEIAARHNISYPPLRGCLAGVEVDVSVRFSEAFGVQPGCPLPLLGMNKASLELGSSLALTANITEPSAGTMISLGFISSQSSGLLLHTGEQDNGLALSLVDGHVEMKDSVNVLKSKNRYDEGRWHYVTAFRNSKGMELNVDNSDRGEKLVPFTATAAKLTDIVFGKKNFIGCLRNFYMRRLENRYAPVDLSNFTQSGDVSMGLCNMQQRPLSLTDRNSFKKKGPEKSSSFKKKGPEKSSSFKKKGHEKSSSFKKPDCGEPVSLIQSYHLSAGSQLQYHIPAQDLNFRPHFSLDMRTRSADGLLLHIADNQGVARVVLFMSGGRVKLSVGDGVLIYYLRKINNGDWHNIRFAVEQDSTHLLVDGFRVTDGQLKKYEGIMMNLQPPVYVGAGKNQPGTRIQNKGFPKKSVTGCIRDIRFYDILVGEPAVNHGGAPCFDGAARQGAYFAGGGSYLALENSVMDAEFALTFEVQPRKLTGLLFYYRGHQGQSMSVFLEKGTMVVQMNDGAGSYNTSVTPPLPSCDSFHRVTVNKKGNVLNLKLGKDYNSAVGPRVLSYSQTRQTFYIGGVPEKKRKHLPVWSSYTGCLRNVRINQAALSFESVTAVFGSINTDECPA